MRCSICHTTLEPDGQSKYDKRAVYADCPHKGKLWHTRRNFNPYQDKIPETDKSEMQSGGNK